MIVLDIFIGLVLIYFLYSLLSSIIAEMIATWIGMRARMLRQGIDNILNDVTIKKSKTDFIRWIKDIFLVEDKNFKYTTAGKFYEEATIKYLAKCGEHKNYSLRNRKPAYISKENFALTVINMLATKGKGISEWEKIRFTIEQNALHLDEETNKMFNDFLKRCNDDFQEFGNLLLNHFDETMDRVNGWYKRKIGTFIFFIGFILCVAFNVDTFEIAEILIKNKNVRTEMLALAENMVSKKNYIDSLTTKRDSIPNAQFLKEAYAFNLTSIEKTKYILGNGWDFVNVNKTFTIVNENCFCKGLITKDYRNGITAAYDSISILKAKIYELEKTLDKSPLKVKIQTQIRELKNYVLYYKSKVSTLTKMNIDELIYINELASNQLSIQAKIKRTWTQKAAFIWSKSHPLKAKFWGFIITALALSLGAQFWFDLLKKLLALRGAGVKPEEKATKDKLEKQLNIQGDFVNTKNKIDIAIAENSAYWMTLKGVLGINASPTDDKIQIICDQGFDVNKIGKNVNIINYIDTVDIEYIVGEKASLTDDNQQLGNGYIYFKNPDQRGTAAGIFTNKKTGKTCILTCAHVMQSGLTSFINDQDNAVHIGNENVGNLTNMIRSSFIDAAIIDVNNTSLFESKYKVLKISTILPHTALPQKPNFKIFVHSFDNLSQTPKLIEGTIFMNSFDYTFSDDKYVYRMFLIEHLGDFKTRSGDSGALVSYTNITNEKESFAIGMLVGSGVFGGKNYSLCLSLQEICDALCIEVITPKKSIS